MAQYVFTMNRVGKIVPPKRQILKDISLSFFPGAKIGVLGLNGAGKSTLLKIMAGLDTEIEGQATPMPGLRVGYLPQEPQLDATRTVRDEVEGLFFGEKRLGFNLFFLRFVVFSFLSFVRACTRPVVDEPINQPPKCMTRPTPRNPTTPRRAPRTRRATHLGEGDAEELRAGHIHHRGGPGAIARLLRKNGDGL